MFGILFLVLILLSGLGVWYLSSRIRKYEKIKSIGKKGIILSVLMPLGFIVLLFLCGVGVFNIVIVVLHFIVAMLLCGLFAIIVSYFSKKPRNNIVEDISAIVLTAIYLGFGWFFAHYVFETHYSFDTQKDIGRENLRVVQIADSHLGITLDGEAFAEQIERIGETNPDIVVITGDFVDDDAIKSDMLTACEALGNLKTTYGIYFVFGNHDEGYFNSRDFSSEELRENLLSNGVKILEDETVLIDEKIYLIGRNDRSDRNRKSMNELVLDIDKSKYMIVLDHQPNDYDAEAEAEVDLVLSGHTHGGHIWPAGYVGLWMGSNDFVYGTETRNKTDFVVTSGISGWGIPFKTGAISEYVVIDIK